MDNHALMEDMQQEQDLIVNVFALMDSLVIIARLLVLVQADLTIFNAGIMVLQLEDQVTVHACVREDIVAKTVKLLMIVAMDQICYLV